MRREVKKLFLSAVRLSGMVVENNVHVMSAAYLPWETVSFKLSLSDNLFRSYKTVFLRI